MSTQTEIDATVAAFVADLTQILRRAALERVQTILVRQDHEARSDAQRARRPVAPSPPPAKRQPPPAPKPRPKERFERYEPRAESRPEPPKPVVEVRPPVQVVRFPTPVPRTRRKKLDGPTKPPVRAESLLAPAGEAEHASGADATPPDARKWVVVRRPAKARLETEIEDAVES